MRAGMNLDVQVRGVMKHLIRSIWHEWMHLKNPLFVALGESSALSAEKFRWSLGLQKQAVYCEVIICAVSPLLSPISGCLYPLFNWDREKQNQIAHWQPEDEKIPLNGEMFSKEKVWEIFTLLLCGNNEKTDRSKVKSIPPSLDTHTQPD